MKITAKDLYDTEAIEKEMDKTDRDIRRTTRIINVTFIVAGVVALTSIIYFIITLYS